jgi:hypothetical protein
MLEILGAEAFNLDIIKLKSFYMIQKEGLMILLKCLSTEEMVNMRTYHTFVSQKRVRFIS